MFKIPHFYSIVYILAALTVHAEERHARRPGNVEHLARAEFGAAHLASALHVPQHEHVVGRVGEENARAVGLHFHEEQLAPLVRPSAQLVDKLAVLRVPGPRIFEKKLN